MKRIYLLLFLILSSISYGQDKFYVYMKDGNVRSFFCDEVDSITYSRLDAVGKLQPDFEVQKICLPDTIYTIPLSEIDSVSFKDPEVIFAKEVRFVSEDFLSNIENIQDSTLLLKGTISSSLLPLEGEVLIDTISERRFIGKIVSLEKINDTWEVKLTAPILTEIYEQLIFTEYFSLEENPLRANGVIGIKFGFNPGCYGSFSMSDIRVGGNKIETCIRDQKLKGFYVILAFDSRLQVGFKGELSKPYDFPILERLIPITAGYGCLSFKVGLGVFAGLSGSFDFYRGQDSQVAMAFEFKEGVCAGGVRVQQSPETYSQLDFEGNAEVGLKLNVGIGTTFWKDTFGITSEMKYNINGKIALPIEGVIIPGEFYSSNKDSKLAFNLPWSIDVLVPERLKKELEKAYVDLDLSLIKGIFGQPYEKYLLPTFALQADPYKDDPTKAIIRMNVGRNLLFGQQVGIGLYDEHENFLAEILTKDVYPGKGFTNPYPFTVSQLSQGTSYIIKPLTKLNSSKIICEPTLVYTTEREDPDPTPSGLVGTWEYRSLDGGFEHLVYQFNADGTFIWKDMEEDGTVDDSTEGTYVYNEDTHILILSVNGETFSNEVRLTKEALFFRMNYGEGDVWDEYKKTK